jgi:uncharacterized protein with GYD domain
MAHYVILINWTDQGIRNVKESPKRAEAARKAVEKAGGKMTLYYTMGQYDIVAIAEAANDEAFMQVLLALGSLGSVRTTTLKAFTEEEASKIIGKLQ